jgi:negative regulator of replication initiation
VKRKVYRQNRLALLVAFGVIVCSTYVYVGQSFGHFVIRAAFAQEVMEESGAGDALSEDVLGDNDEAAADDVLFEEVSDIASEDDALTGSDVDDMREKIIADIRKNRNRAIDRMPSLFFTYWQHQSIIDAKNSHGRVRPPTEAELKALEEEEQLELDPSRRYVSLGGIVYKADDDWTIWLNGNRVTPNAVPKQVIDLRVYKDYIEVKWLDEYTNSIFPLRLRAHQRFNMDMRIFLPG